MYFLSCLPNYQKSDNANWEQMHFYGIFSYTSYEKCLVAVEFEVERLKEHFANFAQAKSKAKNGKAPNQRR